jgi:Ca-activated chloride channel family protein
MKKLTRALIAALFWISPVPAMALHVPPPVLTLEGKLNCPVISERGGTAFLQITLTSPEIVKEKKRKPMNLSIVLDRSGSMGDQKKMEYAKKAFASLIDQLHAEDILSIVIYDDIIDVVRHASKVGRDRNFIKRLIDEVYPRGSTNLGGGLIEGLKQAERYLGKEYINRVILLSDGLANVGVTNPSELNSIARRYRNQSISITTMGVGLDYNENLMMGLSESGGGNYYFIEHPNSLTSIVRQEFDMVSSVIAQNVSIYLHLSAGVSVHDVIGCECTPENEQYIIPVGDLYANETREFTVELSIPPGRGTKRIVTGELRYESSIIAASFPTFSTSVRYTKNFAEVEQNRDLTTQAKADIAVSTQKVEQAMQALEVGNKDEAEKQLNEARAIISASPAASAAGASGESVRSQIGKIATYQKTAREDDANRAKKSIQYENYKTRKNK